MLLECLKELCEDFIRGPLSRLDIWVHLCVIRTSDIVKVDLAVSCLIQDLEGFEGKVGSELVHGSNYDSNKLIEVNLTITCVVEALEQSCKILGFDVDSEILNGFVKLVWVE